MIKHFYTLLLSLALTSAATAQRSAIYQPVGNLYMREYDKLGKQPVAVLLPTPMDSKRFQGRPKALAKFAIYQADVEARRAAFESALKFWSLPYALTYVTEAEAQKLYDDRKKAHLLLTFSGSLRLCWVGKVARLTVIQAMAETQGSKYSIPQPSNEREAAFQTFFPNPNDYWVETYHASDVICAMQQLQVYVEQRVKGRREQDIEQDAKNRIGKSSELLRSKTLLLCSDQLSENLPENKIAGLYPYPVQVTDRATIETAVASADPRYLYAHYVTVVGNNGFQLVDAANGQAIGYAEFSMLRPTDLGKLQDWMLKALAKSATGKGKI